MTPRWAISSWRRSTLARTDWAAVRDQVAVDYPSAADATAHRDDFLDLGAGLSVYDNEQWRSEAATGITRFLQPFTIAGYVVMTAAGLSVLNVFVLGLVQRKRERAVLRAIGATFPGRSRPSSSRTRGCSVCWSLFSVGLGVWA